VVDVRHFRVTGHPKEKKTEAQLKRDAALYDSEQLCLIAYTFGIRSFVITCSHVDRGEAKEKYVDPPLEVSH
jgi:hypothetical protein